MEAELQPGPKPGVAFRCYVAILVAIALVAVQIGIVSAILHAHGLTLNVSGISSSILSSLLLFCYGFIGLTVLFAFRRKAAAYVRMTLGDVGWVVLAALLAINLGMLSFFYQVLKTGVWLIGTGAIDAQLWELDRAVFFGMSPNVFFVNLLANRALLAIFDVGYGLIFLVALTIAVAVFLARPGVVERTSFLVGNTILWSVGAWLYLAVPAMGPAFGFSDAWDDVRPALPATTQLQRRLLENHLNILNRSDGHPVTRIRFAEGIGAFPSLHVGFFAFLSFFVRRSSPRLGRWLLGATAFMFVGSIVTGWHYMIDSIAGLLLGWLVHRLISLLEPSWAGSREPEQAGS